MQEQSALLLPIPEANDLVAKHRNLYDKSARDGIPAHITLLYPFVPPEAITSETIEVLSSIFTTIPAFEVTFATTARFGDSVLYLQPDNPAKFSAITDAIFTAFPDHPPYEGMFDEVIPHLTVADDATPEIINQLDDELSSVLPISGTAAQVVLMQGIVGNPWEELHHFNFRK